MATSFPFSEQRSLQPIAPNLSLLSQGEPHSSNSLTIVGNVHSTGDSNISKDLTILGDLSSSGSVTIDGVIEGNIYCTSLIIMANGRVNGAIVAVQQVIVRGKVTGAIRSRRVILQSCAKVEGDIFYQRVGIEMGAHHDGVLRRTEDDNVLGEPNSRTPGEQGASEANCDSARIEDPPESYS